MKEIKMTKAENNLLVTGMSLMALGVIGTFAGLFIMILVIAVVVCLL